MDRRSGSAWFCADETWAKTYASAREPGANPPVILGHKLGECLRMACKYECKAVWECTTHVSEACKCSTNAEPQLYQTKKENDGRDQETLSGYVVNPVKRLFSLCSHNAPPKHSPESEEKLNDEGGKSGANLPSERSARERKWSEKAPKRPTFSVPLDNDLRTGLTAKLQGAFVTTASRSPQPFTPIK